MTASSLRDKLLIYIQPAYPHISIDVNDENEHRHITFIDSKFANLYQQQRYHYLLQLIPKDFFDAELQNTIWHELAPGENTDDLDYLDEDVIDKIKDNILEILRERTNFVATLDHLFLNQKAICHGDYRHSKQILAGLHFSEEEQFDIFHVMMSEGGYCDCEILYNTFTESSYAKKYWMERNKQ